MECLIVRALPTLQILFLACKNAWKCAISTLIFWKIFWGHSPQTPILGRGYDPTPHGAPALRASRASLGTFGPSIVRPWYRMIFAIPILKRFRRPWTLTVMLHHVAKLLTKSRKIKHVHEVLCAKQTRKMRCNNIHAQKKQTTNFSAVF